MASSGEKIILIVILLVICYFAFFGIMPMFFMRGGFPFQGHILGMPRTFTIMMLPLLLLSLVWLFVVVWVYRDAERRGMSGVLWALLVLVGNFVGLLIYLIVRNDEAPRMHIADERELCSKCGNSVLKSYTYCPHCGSRLKSVCPNCGKMVSDEWLVCPLCSEKLVGKK